MELLNCPRCGGNHWGQYECPFTDEALILMGKQPLGMPKPPKAPLPKAPKPAAPKPSAPKPSAPKPIPGVKY